MFDSIRTWLGVWRSFRIYYGDQKRAAAMDRLYADFLKPGEMAFDIGAHVGDRIASFRRLGAKVVAVEPQPALVKVMLMIYGKSYEIKILKAAIGRSTGEVDLRGERKQSDDLDRFGGFCSRGGAIERLARGKWTKTLRVPMITLDELIKEYGEPAFIKIDVEGFEAEALAGLSRPVRSLSFEFTTIQRDVAKAALARCVELGYTRFNAALGESQRFEEDEWCDAAAIEAWLVALPDSANSGDIYAALA